MAKPFFMSTYKEAGYSIVLFDGMCNLCSAFVRFTIRYDRKKQFRFAALQSAAAKSVLADPEIRKRKDEPLQSVVLIDEDKFYFKSDAVLKIAGKLPAPWPVFKIFAVLPRKIRDRLYDFVARNRYRWFGKKNEMMQPSPAEHKYFL